MAVLAGHWAKLDAVNQILHVIGEDPVNSLSSGLGDAELAESVLDKVSREIQQVGWHVNTRKGIVLTTDVNNMFVLPDNTLRVDTVNPRAPRRQSTPSGSAFIDATMRRDGADTKWIMYDSDNDSETWTDVTSLTVTIIQFLEYANLTPALQRYVTAKAAHRFQKGAMGSRALFEFTLEDVNDALIIAVNEDMENEDTNLIRDNAQVHDIAYRNNPRFGR